MADSKPVLLCLPAQAEALQGKAQSEVVLKRGMLVARADSQGQPMTEPVKFDGDLSKFVNALALAVHPIGVRWRSREVERAVVLDGEQTTAKVGVHTCFLVDG